jgi:hypothetical protein
MLYCIWISHEFRSELLGSFHSDCFTRVKAEDAWYHCGLLLLMHKRLYGLQLELQG